MRDMYAIVMKRFPRVSDEWNESRVR